MIKDVGFQTPESVQHDVATDTYLVSNINGSPLDKDDNGFISKLSPEGQVINLKWIDGAAADVELNAPKGIGISNGIDLWAVRYATNGSPRSLFASADVETLRSLHAENPRFDSLSDSDRVIVSEPFSDLPGVWHEIPPSTAVTVRSGGVLEHQAFRPRRPALAGEVTS